METKSRTYRYFSTITLFISLMAIFFACVAFASFPSENIGGEWVVIFFLFVLSALCLYGTLFSTYSVAVTEKEIIAKYLWRRKILVWRGLDKIIPKSNGSFSLLNRGLDQSKHWFRFFGTRAEPVKYACSENGTSQTLVPLRFISFAAGRRMNMAYPFFVPKEKKT